MAELPVPVIWQNCLSVDSAYNVEELASDLAELPVPVIWQNCLSVDRVPVIWWNCLCQRFGRIASASDLAELSVCGQCASDLAELYVCGGACQ